MISLCRYDLLCLEGLAKALRIFTRKDPTPRFRVAEIPSKAVHRIVVKPEVGVNVSGLYFQSVGG